MLINPFSLNDSKRRVILGDVFDALIKPHDSEFDIFIQSNSFGGMGSH